MGLVSKRYAQALLEASLKENKLEDFRGQLEQVSLAIASDTGIMDFLSNPNLLKREKTEILEKVFGEHINRTLMDFIIMLVNKDRILLIRDISEEFSLLVDKHLNVLRLKVFSAAPLSESQSKKLLEKFRSLYGAASVKAVFEIDKTLLGGIKVIIGDTVIDGSIKGRLEDLGEEIIKKNI